MQNKQKVNKDTNNDVKIGEKIYSNSEMHLINFLLKLQYFLKTGP